MQIRWLLFLQSVQIPYRILLIGYVLIACHAVIYAQDEESFLFSEEGEEPIASDQSQIASESVQVLWSGIIDSRMIKTGKALRWQDGGPSLSRYGGVDTNDDGYGDRASIFLETPQIALISEILIEGNLAGVIQFNFDDSYDAARMNGRLGVVEAYLQHKTSFGERHPVRIRVGRLIPPFSLEHPDTAWSTRYTITPSAINAWISEELRPSALEIQYQYEYSVFSHVELMIAPFSGNDSSGSILSWRGWALHDYQATLGSRIRFSENTPEFIVPHDQWGEPFKEIDGNLGVYGKVGWVPNTQWKIEGFFSNSFADTEEIDPKHEYAWDTWFGNLSLAYKAADTWTFLFQGITGNTRMGNPDKPGVNNNFSAWYGLYSYTSGSHRFTLRHDVFEVSDLDHIAITNDEGAIISDDNNAHGKAVTLAYFYYPGEFHMVGMEYLNIDSQRKNNGIYPDDPDDDVVQLMVRLIF